MCHVRASDNYKLRLWVFFPHLNMCVDFLNSDLGVICVWPITAAVSVTIYKTI